MELRQLPIPSFFEPKKVKDIWRVPYQERAKEAEEWKERHSIPPAYKDDFRICLFLIDLQNTFCIPDFELFVAGRSGRGAVDDCINICEFIYTNLSHITEIVITMDTHQTVQIFHSIFFKDPEGRHPEPYTIITRDDVIGGRWKIAEECIYALGIEKDYGDRFLLHYIERLKEMGKYQLTIWPYHGMLGGIGHALVPSLEEAIFFHSLCRYSQPLFRLKGNYPLTEFYSALRAEVTDDHEGKNIAEEDQSLFEHLLSFDAIIIAGEAKSHCVAWTVEDLLEKLRDRDPSLTRKIYLLEDCASPVVIPEVVDYTDQADSAFKRFESMGAHIVKAKDPLNKWLITQSSP